VRGNNKSDRKTEFMERSNKAYPQGGGAFPVYVSVTLLKDEADAPAGTLMVAQDVTKQKNFKVKPYHTQNLDELSCLDTLSYRRNPTGDYRLALADRSTGEKLIILSPQGIFCMSPSEGNPR